MRFRAFTYASLRTCTGLFRCREKGFQRGGRHVLRHENSEQKEINEKNGDIWEDTTA